MPHADFGPIKVPDGPADDRFVYLSDVLPTAWQRSPTQTCRPVAVTSLAHKGVGMLPAAAAKPLINHMAIDRLGTLLLAIDLVRRGGTISLSGVYDGMADPLPLRTMFDKQLTLRMGQANVRRWADKILPLLDDDDPLGVDDFATHRVPLDDAAWAYETFQHRRDGAVKILFTP